MKRAVLAAFAAASILLSVPVEAQTLRWAAPGDAVSFDPNAQLDSFTQNIQLMVYDTLVRRNRQLQIEPGLATSWKIVAPDRWRFTLRPGVKFHDGQPFGADDVVATVMRTIDPGSRNKGNLATVKAAEKVDDLTVDLVLTGPYPLLLNDLTGIFVMSKAWLVEHDAVKPGNTSTGVTTYASTHANGTGPFKLVSYEPDRKIVVERNPSYWDPARPVVDKVEVLVYPDRTAEASAIISGDTDLMMSTSAGEFMRLSKAAGIKALRIPSGQFLNVNMACDQKPFDDIRVRKALALTIDREAMVGFVAGGYGTPGNDAPMSPAYRYYADAPLLKPNMAEAKKLLAEAGYPNGIDVTLVASDTPSTRAQLAVAIREMAKPAGFRITVQTMPHATYLDQVWKKGAFYVGFYNMQATADAIFALLFTSDAAWNETRWNNKAFDEVVYKARAETDDAKRRPLYAEAQKMMRDGVPAVIPVFFDLLAAQRAYLQGYVLHPRASVFRLDRVWLGDGAPKRG